jgi:hypothetical protein
MKSVAVGQYYLPPPLGRSGSLAMFTAMRRASSLGGFVSYQLDI